MCGRYTIIATVKEIERRFGVEVPAAYGPRYNAAPTQLLPVITNESPGQLVFFRWGLQPSWAMDKATPPLINSRIETITEKPAFRNSLMQCRCLVPADGYYEWKRLSKKSKIPYRIGLEKNELFSFAGIWTVAVDEKQNSRYSFSIITTTATNELASIHDRMPVILNREEEKLWLTESFAGGDYTGFLINNMNSKLTYYSVSSLVNSVNNEGSALIKPALAMDQFGNLDLFG
ncbi:MAG: SOS response-associated peptidase [Cyclobacteriaceae bacterium]|nr:SOS response-associated peptidase [Cyclobacteriaceae bacterium]